MIQLQALLLSVSDGFNDTFQIIFSGKYGANFEFLTVYQRFYQSMIMKEQFDK